MSEADERDMVKIVDMAVNPPPERMSEHANLSQMQAYAFSLLQMSSVAAHDLMDISRARAKEDDSETDIILYADAFQDAYMRRSRSIAGRTTDASFKLAEAEIEARGGEYDGHNEPRELGRR